MKDKYLKYILNTPRLYPVIFKRILNKIFRYISNRFEDNNRDLFKKDDFDTKKRQEIADDAKNISIPDIQYLFLNNLPSLNLKLKGKYFNINKIKIPLATFSVNLESSFFNENYEDNEDYFAANRFIWLYEILLNYPYENVLKFCYQKIFKWIDENKLPSDDKKFESYSISERLISWLFFIQFTKKYIKISETNAKILTDSISIQINHLIKHLEYHGEGTNNHILNNARALYIVGRLLVIKQIELLGKKIFNYEYKNIIKGGVYQEGSTHYQMLITKNLIEVLLVADKTNDIEYKEYLSPLIIKMLHVCNRLQSNISDKQFPLFGDISPDMPPDWFVGYPFSTNGVSSKWYNLFQYNIRESLQNKKPIINFVCTSSGINWMKIEKNDFEIWANTRTGKIPCHGHNDNGSIIIFYKGNPIITDLGRCDYLRGGKNFQVQAEAHNMPIVNGYAPDIPYSSLIKKIGIISMTTTNIEKHSIDRISFTVKYFNKNILIKREISITKIGLRIKDYIISNYKRINVQYYWHMNLNIIPINNYIFRNNILEFKFSEESMVESQILNNYKSYTKYGKGNCVKTIYTKFMSSKSLVSVLEIKEAV